MKIQKSSSMLTPLLPHQTLAQLTSAIPTHLIQDNMM